MTQDYKDHTFLGQYLTFFSGNTVSYPYGGTHSTKKYEGATNRIGKIIRSCDLRFRFLCCAQNLTQDLVIYRKKR